MCLSSPRKLDFTAFYLRYNNDKVRKLNCTAFIYVDELRNMGQFKNRLNDPEAMVEKVSF